MLYVEQVTLAKAAEAFLSKRDLADTTRRKYRDILAVLRDEFSDVSLVDVAGPAAGLGSAARADSFGCRPRNRTRGRHDNHLHLVAPGSTTSVISWRGG